MSDFSRRKAIDFATKYASDWDGYTATSPIQPTVTVVDGDFSQMGSYLTLATDLYDQFFGTRVIGYQERPKVLDIALEPKRPEPKSMNRHQRRAKAARAKRRR